MAAKPPYLHSYLSDALALLAGVLLTLAFAPFEFFLLAVLAPAALLYLWRNTSPKQAAWRGFLFGLGHFSSGVYWVYISLYTYGNAPVMFAVLLTLLLIVYMASYPAALGYLLRRLSPRPDWSTYLLTAPALWILLEWVRSWMLSGFPWLSLGYSQVDSPIGQFSTYFGVFGCGWIVVLSAGLIVLIVTPKAWPYRIAYTLSLLLIWLGATSLTHLQWSSPIGQPLQISLIQGNINQTQKWQLEERERILQLYTELSLSVAAESDVIIWPETALPTFFSLIDEGFITALHEHAHATDTDYLIGTAVGDWDKSLFHNSVVSIGANDGQHFYHKHHLLPFGEYLPFRFLFNLFHRFVDIPMADFTAGVKQQPLLRAANHDVGVSICYEAAFGNEIRRTLPQATLLVNVSNDDWFGDSLAPHQHLQIARMRTLETSRPMARATNTGISALIDHTGKIVADGAQFKPLVIQGSLQPQQGSTPYVRFGDLPILGLAALSLFIVWLQQRFLLI